MEPETFPPRLETHQESLPRRDRAHARENAHRGDGARGAMGAVEGYRVSVCVVESTIRGGKGANTALGAGGVGAMV